MSSENSRHWVMPRRLFRPDFIENRFVGPDVLSEDLPVFVFSCSIFVRSNDISYLPLRDNEDLSVFVLSDSMILISCSCLLHASPWQWAPASRSRSPPPSSSAQPSTPPSGALAPPRSDPTWDNYRIAPFSLLRVKLIPGNLPQSHCLLVKWYRRGNPETKELIRH